MMSCKLQIGACARVVLQAVHDLRRELWHINVANVADALSLLRVSLPTKTLLFW